MNRDSIKVSDNQLALDTWLPGFKRRTTFFAHLFDSKMT